MNPRYLLLYLPVFLSYLLQSTNPSQSYWIAWGGSLWIYIVTFIGAVKKLPTDRPVLNQVFRPFFLVHLIFSSYMVITSVFFYLDSMGYLYFDKVKPEESFVYISNIAYCQFLYCLGHAAYVHGILLFLEYKPPKYVIQISSGFSISRLFLFATLFFFLVSIVFRFVPGLFQFSVQFQFCTAIFAVFSFGYSILEKKNIYIFITALLFAYGEFQALTSGWKEITVLPILLLGAILWARYKRIILILSPFILFVFIFVVPYYTNIVRGLSWGESIDSQKAAAIALDKVKNENVSGLLENNWDFLINRLSEISMFMIYVDKVPIEVPYMTEEILSQSLESIIPRILSTNKENTEVLVMQRVYALGVVSRDSDVSAKPAFIADAYLMGGELGIFCSLFLLGLLITFLSKKAESLFGGYAIGSGAIFLGLFYILIRGTAFEFMVNTVFWSTVTMYLLFYIGKTFSILVKNPNYR
jgi:hypothetical protein